VAVPEAEVERRRREDRGAEGADGVPPSPRGERSGEGAVPPSPENFFDF